jgi:hypothetical protein
MNDDVFFTLDLTSKNYLTNQKLEDIQNKIKSIEPESPVFSAIADSCEFNKKFQLEIYLEAFPSEIENPEELLDIIIEIEEKVGNFQDKSQVEWISNFPHVVKNWEKNGYSWSLVLQEEDDYYSSEDSLEEWEDE